MKKGRAQLSEAEFDEIELYTHPCCCQAVVQHTIHRRFESHAILSNDFIDDDFLSSPSVSVLQSKIAIVIGTFRFHW